MKENEKYSYSFKLFGFIRKRERKWLEEKREIKNKKEREKGGKEKARDRMSQQKMYIKKTTNNWKEWKKQRKIEIETYIHKERESGVQIIVMENT